MNIVNYAIIAVAIIVMFFALGGLVIFVAWVRDTYRLGKEIHDSHD